MSKRPFRTRISRAARLAWQEMTGTRSAYEGAALHRLLLDWIVQARSADEEIRGDLRMLRARARALGRNNSYVKRYFRLIQNNVIGPTGIKLQAQTTDKTANSTIEAAWKDWAESPVTTDGRLTLRRLERLLLKTMACDGEALVRLHQAPEYRYGLACQPIDVDLLDETHNVPRQGSRNEIRMGVELDVSGKPVAYWLWDSPIGAAGITGMRSRYRVPAEEIIHLYDPDRVNQTRGVTWVHSVMVPAHMLNGYEESEAVAARIAAAKMGFFERKSEAFSGDLSNSPKPATMEAAPGSLEFSPDGYEFKSWDPQHPTQQFPAFVKQMLRKIASGFSVFYNVLANDAEGVTYSTMRSFALIERDDWRSIQQDFIDMWRRPLYAAWIRMAIVSRELRIGQGIPEPWMFAVRHRPRGWQWIDPEKEAKAAVLSIENGLGTRTGFLAEKGEDLEDVFAELAREQELAEKYGLKVSGNGGNPKAADDETTKRNPDPDEDPEEEPEEDQDEDEKGV